MSIYYRGNRRRNQDENPKDKPFLQKTKEGCKMFFGKVRRGLVYAWDWICHIVFSIGELQPSKGVLAASLALIAALSLLVSLPHASALMEVKNIELVRNGQKAMLTTSAHTVAELISSFGYQVGEGDVIYPDLSHVLQDGDSVSIRGAIRLHVTADGQTRQVSMLTGSVGQALYLAGVELAENDEVSPSLDTPVTDGMDIVVSRIQIRFESEEQRIPYQVVYQDDSSMYLGKEKLYRQGEEGVKELKMRVVVRDGVEVERQLVRENILEAAQNRIINKGVKATPTPTPKATPKPSASATKKPSSSSSTTSGSKATPDPNKKTASEQGSNTIVVDGKTYTFKEKMTMELTAYTHTGRKTATGTWPDLGTLSVDPSVIPYGTKVFVEGYGFGVARDTGVSGMRIDVFLNTEAECRTFGRRRNKAVYILD